MEHNISSNIKKHRELKGLTQDELAQQMGVSRQTVIGWESGTLPRETKLDKLSKVLGIKFTSFGVEEIQPKRESLDIRVIPFYDAVAVGGNSILADQAPIDQPTEMINPGTFFRTAQGALRVYGHSMFPKYPAGCIIAYRNGTDMSVIHYGEDYVIELEDRRIVKRVQKSKEPGHIQVNSYNSMKDDTGSMVYSSYDIPLKAVKRMYTVLGKIELEASI